MLNKNFPRLEVAAGALIFGQGEPGGSLLLIEEGEVALSRRFLGGEVELRVLGPGAPLGVASFQGEEPREATARALVDTRLIRFDPGLLTRIIREQPELALRLLAGVAAQLTAADNERRPSLGEAEPPAVDPITESVSLAALNERGAGVVATLLWHASGISFALPDHGEVTLGRSHRHNETPPDIDLSELPEARSVSRQHAHLRIERAAIWVREDPSARNGTFVNGVRLAPGELLQLADNTRLRLGLVELSVLRSRGA